MDEVMIPMPDITAYQFGRMTINGKSFTTDLVILPSGEIIDCWIRSSGHLMEQEDIKALIHAEPEHLIVGTGASGRMKVSPGLLSQLSSHAITVDIYPTGQAVQLYNQKIQTCRKISACFHLTC